MDKEEIKKLSLGKVTLFTILATIFAFFMGLFVGCFAAPGAMANFVSKMGVKGFTVSLSKMQYDRTESIEDLSVLLDRAIWADDCKVIVQYTELLIFDEEYADFVKHKDVKDNADSGIDYAMQYDRYIKSNYVYALYRLGDGEKAFTLARQYVTGKTSENAFLETYGDSNPMTKLVLAYRENGGKGLESATLTSFLQRQFEYLAAKEDESYYRSLKNLARDLYAVCKIDNEQNAAHWEFEYNRYKKLLETEAGDVES